MKLSDITLTEVKEYLRIDYDYEDKLIKIFMDSAKSKIINFTGLSPDIIDSKEDLTVTYLALIQHFYDNRGISIDSEKTNKIIENILNMHSVNLL